MLKGAPRGLLAVTAQTDKVHVARSERGRGSPPSRPVSGEVRRFRKDEDVRGHGPLKNGLSQHFNLSRRASLTLSTFLERGQ